MTDEFGGVSVEEPKTDEFGGVAFEEPAAPDRAIQSPNILQSLAGTATLSPQQRAEAWAAFQASPIPELNIQGATIPGKIAAATANVASRLGRGVVSPMGAFLLPLGMAGAIPRAAMGLGFGLPLAASGLKQVYQGAATGETQPVIEGALGTLAGGLMTTGGVRELLPNQTPIKPVELASDELKTLQSAYKTRQSEQLQAGTQTGPEGRSGIGQVESDEPASLAWLKSIAENDQAAQSNAAAKLLGTPLESAAGQEAILGSPNIGGGALRAPSPIGEAIGPEAEAIGALSSQERQRAGQLPEESGIDVLRKSYARAPQTSAGPLGQALRSLLKMSNPDEAALGARTLLDLLSKESRPEIKQELINQIKDIVYARQNSPPATVHGYVRSLEESAQGVPAEKGSPRVQSQAEAVAQATSLPLDVEQQSAEQARLAAVLGQEEPAAVSDAVTTFRDQMADRTVPVRNNQTAEAGMGLKSVADLDSMLQMLKDERAASTASLAEAQRTGDFSKMMIGRDQYPREVIETATKTGSWENDFPELGVKGDRPLQWDQNPEVAEWVKQHAKEIWTNPESYEALPDKLKAEAVKPAKTKPTAPAAPISKGITPEHIDWDKPNSWNVVTAQEASSPTLLSQKLKAEELGRVMGKLVSETKRVLVMRDNKDSSIHVVSAYQGPKGMRVVDPRRAKAAHPNKALATILSDYTPQYTMLLKEPVQNFHEKFDSLQDFFEQFGNEARERAAAQRAYPEPPTEIAAPEPTGEPIEITDVEANAVASHFAAFPDTTNAIRAIDAAANKNQIRSALRKQLDKIGETNPELTQEEAAQRLLESLNEIRASVKTPAEFGKSLAEAFRPRATEPVAAQPTSAVAKGISEGPGAASPGDVPPAAPLAAAVSSLPAWQRPNELVTPSSPVFTAISQALLGTANHIAEGLRSLIRAAAGESMPRTTRADQATGEAGVRYAASRDFAPRAASVFSAQTLQGTGVDPVKFGAALVEDNLRSIREGFRAEVTRLTAEGKPAEAAAAKKQADAVASLIAAKDSPFVDEDAYQDFLAEPDTRRAVQQHKQQWEETVDPMYKDAQAIDRDVQLPSRGQQTGARVNLEAVPEREDVGTVVQLGTGAPNLTATFKRKSPFGRKAKGTGQAYQINYHELIANTFVRQLEIANKNAFDKMLVESGNAVIDRPGQQVMIGNERCVSFPLQRRVIAGADREPFSQSQNIYVRQSLAGEYSAASNVEPRFPTLTKLMTALNTSALAGFTDLTVHLSNLATALFNRPVSGSLLMDSLLSATGRADVPITLARVVLKSVKNNEAQLAELAEMGALRKPHPPSGIIGKILAPGGQLINKMDKTTRLLLDDTYQRLAEAGLVEKSETARREYVNQVGQYNRRLQGPLTRFLRDSGLGPFVTAGKTFNALGVRMATLSPGAKSTGAFAEAALRGNVLSKWVGAAVLLGSLNYLITKDRKGGVMGRPGVPIGSLDTGKTDAQGRPLSIPFLDILGLGRGLRVTGAKGFLQSKYLGLTNGNALDSAARDIVNSAVGPAAGPAVRFGFVAASGGPPAIGVPRTAPIAPPGKSQTQVNLGEALKDANPLVRSYVDWRSGKTLREALGQQIPRFSMQPGKTPAMAAKYAQIVNAAQLKTYTEDLAKQLRAIPMKDRYPFAFKKFKADELSPQNRMRAFDELDRRGVFEYQ